MLLRYLCTSAILILCIYVQAQNTSPYWSLSGNSNVTSSSKLGTTNAIPLRILTKNTERIRIDTLGRVGFGLTAPKSRLSVLNNGGTPASTWLSGTPLFSGFAENTTGNGDYVFSMASGTVNARSVLLGKRSRGTLAVPTAVSNNDYLASMMVAGYDGKAFQYPAIIDFLVDGRPASGSVPTRISFTTGSNTTNRAERLRISSNGNISFNTNQLFINKATTNIGIGTTTPESGYKLHVVGGGIKVYREWGTGDEEGNNYGVNAEGHIGVYGNGMIGVSGNGMRGVMGTGHSGVYGNGASIGVEGYSEEGYGGYFESEYNNGLEATTQSGTYAGVFHGAVYLSSGYTTSDANLKQDIREVEGAMDLIDKLKPRYYTFKSDSKYSFLHLPKGEHYGLLAQDVEEVLPNLVSTANHQVKKTVEPSGALKRDSISKTPVRSNEPAGVQEAISVKAVNYTELIPVMIKGMQEQQEENNQLKKQVEYLQERLNKLESLISHLSNSSITSASAYLEQNTPNPVNGSTVIGFYIPENVTIAQLALTNIKGQQIKNVTIANRGSGQVSLNTSSLASGTYIYTLYINHKPIDSKRFVIVK